MLGANREGPALLFLAGLTGPGSGRMSRTQCWPCPCLGLLLALAWAGRCARGSGASVCGLAAAGFKSFRVVP